jgi:ferredoxin
MIVAEQKPLKDIQRMLKGKKKVLTVGCGTCVSVCFAGGKKESSAMAATLRTAAAAEGQELEVDEVAILRSMRVYVQLQKWLRQFQAGIQSCRKLRF